MTNWQIFQGTRQPHDGIDRLPEPPTWRSFSRSGEGAEPRKRGEEYQAQPEEIDLVNAALYLRRPLLVTGKPGTGKTSLAYRNGRVREPLSKPLSFKHGDVETGSREAGKPQSQSYAARVSIRVC